MSDSGKVLYPTDRSSSPFWINLKNHTITTENYEQVLDGIQAELAKLTRPKVVKIYYQKLFKPYEFWLRLLKSIAKLPFVSCIEIYESLNLTLNSKDSQAIAVANLRIPNEIKFISRSEYIVTVRPLITFLIAETPNWEWEWDYCFEDFQAHLEANWFSLPNVVLQMNPIKDDDSSNRPVDPSELGLPFQVPVKYSYETPHDRRYLEVMSMWEGYNLIETVLPPLPIFDKVDLMFRDNLTTLQKITFRSTKDEEDYTQSLVPYLEEFLMKPNRLCTFNNYQLSSTPESRTRRQFTLQNDILFPLNALSAVLKTKLEKSTLIVSDFGSPHTISHLYRSLQCDTLSILREFEASCDQVIAWSAMIRELPLINYRQRQTLFSRRPSYLLNYLVPALMDHPTLTAVSCFLDFLLPTSSVDIAATHQFTMQEGYLPEDVSALCKLMDVTNVQLFISQATYPDHYAPLLAHSCDKRVSGRFSFDQNPPVVGITILELNGEQLDAWITGKVDLTCVAHLTYTHNPVRFLMDLVPLLARVPNLTRLSLRSAPGQGDLDAFITKGLPLLPLLKEVLWMDCSQCAYRALELGYFPPQMTTISSDRKYASMELRIVIDLGITHIRQMSCPGPDLPLILEHAHLFQQAETLWLLDFIGETKLLMELIHLLPNLNCLIMYGCNSQFWEDLYEFLEAPRALQKITDRTLIYGDDMEEKCQVRVQNNERRNKTLVSASVNGSQLRAARQLWYSTYSYSTPS